MKTKDIIVGTVLLIFSGVLYYYADSFPVREGRTRVLNAGYYPQLLAVILGILAFLLLISAIRKKSAGSKKQKFWMSSNSLLLFIITLGMLVIYPFLLTYLGFAVTTFIFILVLVCSLSNKKRINLGIILVSAGITAVIYFVFKVFINIPFPQGYLF